MLIACSWHCVGMAVPRAAGPLAMLCRDGPGPWEGLTVGGRQIVAALGKTGPRAVGPWATHCQGRPAPAKGLPIAAGPLATPSQRWPGPWQTLPRAGRALLRRCLARAGHWQYVAKRFLACCSNCRGRPGLPSVARLSVRSCQGSRALGKNFQRRPGPWRGFAKGGRAFG